MALVGSNRHSAMFAAGQLNQSGVHSRHNAPRTPRQVKHHEQKPEPTINPNLEPVAGFNNLPLVLDHDDIVKTKDA